MINHRTSFTETEIYENETLKNDSILSDYERIQFIENGIGLSAVTFITHNKIIDTRNDGKM